MDPAHLKETNPEVINCNGGRKPTTMNTTVYYDTFIQINFQPTCGLMIPRWIRLQ